MTSAHISDAALTRRAHWISAIVTFSGGSFGHDTDRVVHELEDELRGNRPRALLDHLRLCGTMPELYGRGTSEERLYSKYVDVVIMIALRHVGLQSLVLTERADAADVEAYGPGYSLVADAKAFRLSRKAKHQRDFKVQAIDGWKRGKPYAIVVAPLHQLPHLSSQIYQQAATRNVCVLSYSHLCVLVRVAEGEGTSRAIAVLGDVLRAVETLHPSKSAVAYWSAVNGVLVDAGAHVRALWREEKIASAEALLAARDEALTQIATERDTIMRLSHREALHRLIDVQRIEGREQSVRAMRDNGLLSVGVAE